MTAWVDVRVLDHFVVAGTRTVSFAERGLFEMWSTTTGAAASAGFRHDNSTYVL